METLAIIAITVIVLGVAVLAFYNSQTNSTTGSRVSLDALSRTVNSLEKRTAAVLKERESICTTIRDLRARLDVLAEELECEE